jgi:hypothetical protein
MCGALKIGVAAYFSTAYHRSWLTAALCAFCCRNWLSHSLRPAVQPPRSVLLCCQHCTASRKSLDLTADRGRGRRVEIRLPQLQQFKDGVATARATSDAAALQYIAGHRAEYVRPRGGLNTVIDLAEGLDQAVTVCPRGGNTGAQGEAAEPPTPGV